jgi:hypothetical protein
LVAFLKRLAAACFPRHGGGGASLPGEADRDDMKSDSAVSADRQSIADIQALYRTAIAEETALASGHMSDPYYTSSRGHNVGRDEMVAVIYAEKIVLTPGAAELGDPVLYANRLIGDLEAIKADYRISEDDPDGYGIGTLHSISRKLEPFTRGAFASR